MSFSSRAHLAALAAPRQVRGAVIWPHRSGIVGLVTLAAMLTLGRWLGPWADPAARPAADVRELVTLARVLRLLAA